MRSSYHIALTVPKRYDVLYIVEGNDAGVGSGRRRQLIDWYEFCICISLWNVFEIALGVSVMLSAVRTVLLTFDVYYAYRFAHTSLILITW